MQGERQPTAKEIEELDIRLSYHPGKPEQTERFEALRNQAIIFGLLILDATPVCREQSLALTHLEDALQSAIAAIVRRE